MSAKHERGAVGYVLRKFPVLSETFVLNEILALERLGLRVEVFALAPSRDPRFHAGIVQLKASMNYVPGAADWRTLVRHNRRFAAKRRGAWRAELGRALATLRPAELGRFLQAGWIAERAKRLGVSHLHAHFAHYPTTVAMRAARLAGLSFSFTSHAFDLYREGEARDLVRKLAAARFAVTVSEYNVEYLRSLPGGAGARVELVRNGVDLARFAPPPAPPPEPFTVLAVARFVEKKGLSILIAACARLRDRGHRFRCRIVGKGELRARLEAQIRELDLAGIVDILPPHAHEEIVARFREAHLFALPCVVGADGNRDGLPVSIVEALASGVPVISTPVTGIPEAVRDGVNGRLVPEGDPEALAAAIEELIVDRELLARLAAAARPSVAEAFDQERTALRLLELFTGEPAPAALVRPPLAAASVR